MIGEDDIHDRERMITIKGEDDNLHHSFTHKHTHAHPSDTEVELASSSKSK